MRPRLSPAPRTTTRGAVDGDIHADLAGIGASTATIGAVAHATDALARSTSLARVGTGDLPARTAPSSAARL